MPFNRLSDGQAERLAMMAEEAGEVAQAVGKVLRHGYSSRHPDGGPDNRENLRRELVDVLAVMRIMASDLSPVTEEEVREAMARKLRYAHHQGPGQ